MKKRIAALLFCPLLALAACQSQPAAGPEAAADAEARRIALADLLATGRLNNAQAKSRYYSEMSLSDLKSYREATPAFSVVPLAEITKKEPQERKAETEKPSPILKNLGLSDEDIKAMKEQEARNGCAQ